MICRLFWFTMWFKISFSGNPVFNKEPTCAANKNEVWICRYLLRMGILLYMLICISMETFFLNTLLNKKPLTMKRADNIKKIIIPFMMTIDMEIIAEVSWLPWNRFMKDGRTDFLIKNNRNKKMNNRISGYLAVC